MTKFKTLPGFCQLSTFGEIGEPLVNSLFLPLHQSIKDSIDLLYEARNQLFS